MKDKIRLLVCDLDGTLLNDKKEITSYSCKVLQRAKQEGFLLCFASGRYHQMMSIYAELIGGIHYTISSNGAIVHNELDHSVLLQTTINQAVVQQIAQWLLLKNLAFMIYSDHEIYYAENHPYLLRRLQKHEVITQRAGFFQKLVAKKIGLQTILPEQVVKIVVYEKELAKLCQFKVMAEELSGICLESTGYGLIGVFHETVSKKTALQRVLADSGVTWKQTVVFGDYENDLSMFYCAAYRVAVDNAVKSLKEQATFITNNHNNDGVARYIEKLF